MVVSRLVAAAAAVALMLSPATAPAQEAPAAASAAPVVKTRSGPVRGTIEDGVARFQGVPYAAPPVGDLRWRAPRPAAAWTQVRDAAAPAVGCARQEDCLYLNVTRPAGAKPGAKLPVMVWIHGGAFAIGDSTAGFGAVHDGGEFARKDVVLVTINYRLGRAGWFAHPALTKEGGPVGNYGLMDQVQALKWVKDNISAFGGDPRNVTVFGESAGGISILFLMLAPEAKGLFHKAVVQSGFARTEPKPLAEMEALGAAAAAKAGVTGDEAAAAAALRKLPLSAFPSGPLIGAPDGPFPILDGRLIQGGIAEGFAAGRQMKIPLIIGGNSNEASLVRPQPPQLDAIVEGRDAMLAVFDPQGTGDKNRIVNDLVTAQLVTEPDRNLARLHSKAAPTWLYYFSYVPPERRATSLGARHTAEIRYVFGGPAQNLTADEAPLAQAMNAYWAAFARAGDPDAAGGPAWPRFDAARGPSLEFGSDGIAVREHHLKARLDWVEQSLAK
ncbi:carboxylesterase/lipase family protein [Phenylobacterium terrae]|uniref:Carboxylic ester hydrolase n=1 Tax=Phenylobacterium terrae TaxID=2665495 RepID=A0ABW4MYQ8_9CAUL